MSILRLAARRAGVIDKMVLQVVEEWTLDRTGMESSPASKTAHYVLDQLLHLGYGAAVGAVCGPVRPWCCFRAFASRGRRGSQTSRKASQTSRLISRTASRFNS